MHATDFPVRIFDVDVFGELRANVLLRFLWQTASDATTAAGYDVDWYARQGTLWLIRRTQLEILAPALFRDTLRIRTWVLDVRRVRSQRAYDVTRLADGATLARAVTDWVYVDLARGALAQPPAELQRALMPNGVGSQPRPPSLAADPPAHAAHGTRRVELADLDGVAHVNNAQYAVYAEQALWDALANHGWTIDPQTPAARPRLAAHDLEYFEAARYRDELASRVWISATDDAGFTVDCALHRDDRRSLHARSRWQWPDDAEARAALSAATQSLSNEQ